jgi:hypothetical protein
MSTRDHRTASALHTWSRYRGRPTGEAGWAKRRADRVAKQAKALDRAQARRDPDYTDDDKR